MGGSLRRGVVVCVCLGVLGGPHFAHAQGRPVTSTDLSDAFEAAVTRVAPAVVEIFATSYAPGEGVVASSGDLVTTTRGSGSGVIVDPAGYIITNAHVVGGARRLRVELASAATGRSILPSPGRRLGAQVVGIDLETDLALIKVEGAKLPTVPFGDSDNLRPGQVVLALGSPMGLRNSVSLGVVSAVGRQLEPDSPMIYVQTDASINPGSSGGPLVDTAGRLVGINTLIVSEGGGNDGLGFAAPSNIVRTVYEQLKEYGRVRRGDIGVRAQTITPVMAAGLKLERESGVILADVLPGGPAEAAGLRAGDLVLSLDGKPMENGRQFQVGLYQRPVGTAVAIEVLRGGRVSKVRVTMAERPDVPGLTAAVDPRQNLVARLGILGVDLDPEIAEVLPVRRVPSGVVVASTAAGATDSGEGGLAPGDVIYSVNHVPVLGLADLQRAVGALQTGDAVVLQIEREGEMRYLAFTID